MNEKIGRVLGILIVILVALAALFLIISLFTNDEGWFYATVGCILTENVLGIVKNTLKKDKQ